MWRSPEGYGSISTTYDLRRSPPASSAGSGFGTWNDFSSAQTFCHFASIACGS